MVVTCRTVNELDDYKPCFFEQGPHADEEFYHDMDNPAPSEDIWKKFELLPTPPRSPKHEPLSAEDTFLDLKLVSDKLDSAHLSNDVEDNLQSILIQDCMWSAPGLAAAGIISSEWPKLKEKMLPNLDNVKVCKNPNSTVDINSSECVDPAAVFPYPLNDSKVPVLVGLGAETPSESEESEDDNDDDEEEEEIDVVSVSEHKPQLTIIPPRRKPILPASSSFSAQVAAMHNYSSAAAPPKRVPVVSYSAPHTPSHHIPNNSGKKRSRPSSSPGSPLPSKKQKLVVSESDLRRVVQKLKMCSSSRTNNHHRNQNQNLTSRNSSDSEDCEGKRAQHNVLERKRRNDLKSSFLRLRDNVPDISTQERAPKVIILKKSSDFITSLTLRNRHLESERDQLRHQQERLKRRLQALHRELL